MSKNTQTGLVSYSCLRDIIVYEFHWITNMKWRISSEPEGIIVYLEVHPTQINGFEIDQNGTSISYLERLFLNALYDMRRGFPIHKRDTVSLRDKLWK